jgi:hypothetical protein
MEAFMSWDLEIRDDLYPLTHPEDGEERTFSAFYVIATEVTTGRRFSHDFVFRSARLVDGEDGPTIAGHREDALARAVALLERMQKAQAAGAFDSPVERPHWFPMPAAYGSLTYEQESRDEDFLDL